MPGSSSTKAPTSMMRVTRPSQNQPAAAEDQVALAGIHVLDDAEQPLVDVLIGVLDAVEVDLADRHEAADAVDVDFQAPLVDAGDSAFDGHALGDTGPVGMDGSAL